MMDPRQNDQNIAACKMQRVFLYGDGTASGKHDMQLICRITVPLLIPHGKILGQIIFQLKRMIGGRDPYSVFGIRMIHEVSITFPALCGYGNPTGSLSPEDNFPETVSRGRRIGRLSGNASCNPRLKTL